MESRNQIGQPQADKPRSKTILPPSRHEGIGNALRSAFDPAKSSLPDDMKTLLAALG